MPVRGTELFEALLPLWLDGREVLGDDVRWFDAHTHIGCNDPDGTRATATRSSRASTRPVTSGRSCSRCTSPVAIRPPTTAAARSGGRLVPLCRVDPNADPLAEARRCLAAGARGFKLHPRSEAFELPHPAVEEVVALAAQHRSPTPRGSVPRSSSCARRARPACRHSSCG
jgi:hypothetical protein